MPILTLTPLVYSLSPTKLLIAGEGGIVATNDSALADYIRIGREYGNSGGYDSAFAGFNARMSEFHALWDCGAWTSLKTPSCGAISSQSYTGNS